MFQADPKNESKQNYADDNFEIFCLFPRQLGLKFYGNCIFGDNFNEMSILSVKKKIKKIKKIVNLPSTELAQRMVNVSVQKELRIAV